MAELQDKAARRQAVSPTFSASLASKPTIELQESQRTSLAEGVSMATLGVTQEPLTNMVAVSLSAACAGFLCGHAWRSLSAVWT